MPEPLDFDQMAERIIARPGEARYVIAEELRLLWNARGAADRSAMTVAKGYDQHLDTTLKALDR